MRYDSAAELLCVAAALKSIMLRTISFKEALQKARERQQANGSNSSPNYDVPQLKEYQIAKDIWFWFAAQHCREHNDSAASPSSLVTAQRVEPDPQHEPSGPVAEEELDAAVTSPQCQTSFHVGGGDGRVESTAEGGGGSKPGDRTTGQFPWVLRFLSTFRVLAAALSRDAAATPKLPHNSDARPQHAATQFPPTVQLFLERLDVDERLRNLIEQDLSIASKLLRSNGALDPPLYYEDFKFFDALDASSTFTEERSVVHVAQNMDGDLLVVKDTKAEEPDTAALTRDRFQFFVQQSWPAVDEGTDVATDHGGNGSDPAKEEVTLNPVGVASEVLQRYRDMLYRGKYEYLVDVGTVECSE